jgi:hypothetical protein
MHLHKWTKIEIGGFLYRECQKCFKLQVKPPKYLVWAVVKEGRELPKRNWRCRIKHRWKYDWYGSYTARWCSRCHESQCRDYGRWKWKIDKVGKNK